MSVDSRLHVYVCKILGVIDGDTVKVNIDLGFNCWLNNVSVRLNNFNAPETRTKNLAEKAKGLASKARLQELLPVGSNQIIKTYLDDKYGRILGDFLLLQETVSDLLIREGFGQPYDGKSKL